MLIRCIPLVLGLIMLVSCCSVPAGQSASSSATPSPTRIAQVTQKPTLSFTPTLKPVVTLTYKPYPTRRPTWTRTPGPTSTPYPTFSIVGLVTRTPAPKAQCPPEDPSLQLGTPNPEEGLIHPYVFDALEKGASLRQIVEAVSRTGCRNCLDMVDMTGDGIEEMVIPLFEGIAIAGCYQNQNRILWMSEPYSASQIFGVATVVDMNLDGMTEVVVFDVVTTGSNTTVDILEWDGAQFVSLIEAYHGDDSRSTSTLARALYWYGDFHMSSPHKPEMNNWADILVRDLDGNGTKELILDDDGPGHFDTLINLGPWRGQRQVYEWDGIHFLLSSLELDPPVYRFQAVQDADRLFLLGEYDQALAFYREAIFSERLAWWSLKGMEKFREAFSTGDATLLEPTPTLSSPDPSEYPSLASYARYRIMLHHLAQGWEADARTVYEELLKKNPEGTDGYPYTELASLFWETYQQVGRLPASCLPVIEQARAHPDILESLGSQSHGLQSHVYTPEDICPFEE